MTKENYQEPRVEIVDLCINEGVCLTASGIESGQTETWEEEPFEW